MRLDEALTYDSIAVCPYNPREMGDYRRARYIATRNGLDFMLVWADTFRECEWTMGDTRDRTRGRNDWMPLRYTAPAPWSPPYKVVFRWRSSEDL